MDVSDADVAGLPAGNVRVSNDEFVALWRVATARDRASTLDWYAGAVASTCRWLATAPAGLPNGTASMLRSPATRRTGIPYEELIEAEYLEALVLEERRPRLARTRPGWCEGVRDTLRWAWRREGPPPYEVLAEQPAR